VIGRIRVNENRVNIDMLDEKWVTTQLNSKALQLPHVELDLAIVLTATTEELRAFAVAQATNKEAFSVHYDLVKVP
jgi:hypothetical protein